MVSVEVCWMRWLLTSNDFYSNMLQLSLASLSWSSNIAFLLKFVNKNAEPAQSINESLAYEQPLPIHHEGDELLKRGKLAKISQCTKQNCFCPGKGLAFPHHHHLPPQRVEKQFSKSWVSFLTYSNPRSSFVEELLSKTYRHLIIRAGKKKYSKSFLWWKGL